MRYQDRMSEVDLRSSPVLDHARAATARQLCRPTRRPQPSRGELVPAFRETKLVTLSSIIMLDRNGTILNGPDTGTSLAALPEVRSALRGTPATVLRRNEQHIRHYQWEWLSRAANLRLHYARPIRVNGDVAGVLLVSPLAARAVSRDLRGLGQDPARRRGRSSALLVLLSGRAVRAQSSARSKA